MHLSIMVLALLIILPTLEDALLEAEQISAKFNAHFPHQIKTLSPKHFIHSTQQLVMIIKQIGDIVIVISTFLGAMNMLNNALADLEKRKCIFALHIALGATSQQMSYTVFIEHCLICSFASLTSAIVTFFILWSISLIYSLPFLLNPLSFLLAWGFSILLGGCISIYPITILKQAPVSVLLKGN